MPLPRRTDACENLDADPGLFLSKSRLFTSRPPPDYPTASAGAACSWPTIRLNIRTCLAGINSAEAVVEGMGGNAEKQTPFLRYVDEFVGLSSAPTM